MSLFGKILALFNFFGAIALVLLAIMDYGKRQQWAYSVLRHDLLLTGLPLDHKEKDQQGYPRVNKLSDETIKDMFDPVGGDPVKTQMEELVRVQGKLNNRVTELANTPAAQTHLLARILLPLSDTYLEREELLAVRSYFATPAALDTLKARYQRAFNEAIVPPNVAMGKVPMSFEESFRLAMRTQFGEPSEVFTTLFLAQFPSLQRDEVKKVKFDEMWAAAVKQENDNLQARLNDKYARALLNIPDDVQPGQKAQAEESQKRAIARLLFALCPVVAEEAAENDPQSKAADKGSAAYGTALLEPMSAYKQALPRLYVVCGLRTTLAAISDEAEVVRNLANAASTAQDQDLTNFILDHALILEELKDRAALVQVELDRVADNTTKRDVQRTLVAQRRRDVKQLQDELEESRARTADASAVLHNLSDEVLKVRLKLRDGIKNAEEREKLLRDLESLIQARERASSKK